MGEQVVKVVEVNGDSGRVVFNGQRLKEIFSKPELRDCKVLIYSISGKTRSGKSFLLNNLWRLLKSKHSQVDEEPSEDIPNIFPYTCQCDAETMGVDMTAEPFYVCNGQGQECAIFLMDTQGIEADRESKSQEPDIFAFSTLLSSFQIINVKERIDWNEIDAFAAYCVHARSHSETSRINRPSARLLFLVRDWPCSTQFSYGEAGGDEYFEQKISKASPEIQGLIRCYNEINCFLLPHPGLSISEDGSRHFCDIRNVARQKIVELFDELFSSSTFDGLSANAPNGNDLVRLVEKIEQMNRQTNTSELTGSFKVYKDNYMQQKINACCELYDAEMDRTMIEKEELDHLKIKLKNAEESALQYFTQDFLPPDEYMEEMKKRLQFSYAKRVGASLIEKFKLEWQQVYQEHSTANLFEKMSRTFTRNTFEAIGETQIKELEREIPDMHVLSQLKQEYLEFLNQTCGKKCQEAHLAKNLTLAVGFSVFGFARSFAALPLYAIAVVVNEIKKMEPISFDGQPAEEGSVANDEQDLE